MDQLVQDLEKLRQDVANFDEETENNIKDKLNLHIQQSIETALVQFNTKLENLETSIDDLAQRIYVDQNKTEGDISRLETRTQETATKLENTVAFHKHYVDLRTSDYDSNKFYPLRIVGTSSDFPIRFWATKLGNIPATQSPNRSCVGGWIQLKGSMDRPFLFDFVVAEYDDATSNDLSNEHVFPYLAYPSSGGSTIYCILYVRGGHEYHIQTQTTFPPRVRSTVDDVTYNVLSTRAEDPRGNAGTRFIRFHLENNGRVTNMPLKVLDGTRY